MSINPLYATELQMIDGLEEMLWDAGLENKEELKQRFQVKDMPSLNWALRKLAAIEAKKLEMSNMIVAEIERLKLFAEKETRGLTESENFFKALITEYAADKRAEDPTYKIKTPYGKIAYRKQPDKWLYDEDLLVAYLEQNDFQELIRTKKEPVKTEIKKSFQVGSNGRVYDNDGQLVEGITVEPQPDVLDIKVSEV
ncbi:host-nuclease inhibitor Gam family protein [Paenibacillus sp. LjRoot56]|uniref:host-nuclease inhibitor Gam family protein n=1 Tax=Paenibacillus sp. LjRoot56 TaxID=3342333 RepID=UPI003ECF1D7D